jgi:hypothetical protein
MGKLFTLPSEIARRIAASRLPKERRCVVCGTPFVTVGRGLYDRVACARRAYRARRKERDQHGDQ